MLKKYVKYRLLRILIRIFVSLLVLFVALVLFIRSPWAQCIIVDKAVQYASEKANTKVQVDRLFLTFSGNLSLQGLYVEDLQQDTLIYSEKLELSIGLRPLITGESININYLEWNGVKANVHRKDASTKFNYEFLISAFSPTSTTSTSKLSDSSTTPSPSIDIGDVRLNNLELQYQDDFTGMKSSIELGEMELDVDNIDLDLMEFGVSELNLEDSKITYLQAIPTTIDTISSDDVGAVLIPKIQAEDISFNNVSFNYRSVPDQMNFDVEIGAFDLKEGIIESKQNPLPVIKTEELGLENVNVDFVDESSQMDIKLAIGQLLLEENLADLSELVFRVETFTWNDSKVSLKQNGMSETQTTSTEPFEQKMEFVWPEIDLEVDEISLKNNDVTIQTGDGPYKTGSFNPDYFKLEEITLNAGKTYYRPLESFMELKSLSMNERSGLSISEAAFDATFSDKTIALKNLTLATDQSSIKGNIAILYETFEDLINTPDSMRIRADLTRVSIDPSLAMVFDPSLSANEYMNTISASNIKGSLALQGTMDDIKIPGVNLQWGDSTFLNLKGSITNTLDVDRLRLNLQDIEIKTNRNNLNSIVSEDLLGISLPDQISLKGKIQGGVSNLQTKLGLLTSAGDVFMEGNFTNSDAILVNAEIRAENVLLNEFLGTDLLDTLSFTSSISANGSSVNDLNAELKTDFTNLTYQGYDFSALDLSGQLEDGSGSLEIAYTDRNLDMTMVTFVELDSIAPEFVSNLNVKGADLFALGISTDAIRTGFELNSNFKGNMDLFDLRTSLDNGIAIYDGEAHFLNNLNLIVHSEKDTFNARMNSSILNVQATANQNLNYILPAIENQVNRYLTAVESSSDTLSNPVNLRLNMEILNDPLLSDVFIEPLDKLESVQLSVDFDEAKSELNAKLIAPFTDYLGTSVDSLQLELAGDKEKFNFEIGWAQLESSFLSIDEMTLTGEVKNNILESSLVVFDDNIKLFHFDSELTSQNDTLLFHINPKQLTFNAKPWTISRNNQIKFTERFIDLSDFELSRNQQKLKLDNKFPNRKNEHIGVQFNNFQLSTFTSFLNADRPLASGEMNGEVILEYPFDNYGLLAELGIANLNILEVPTGNLNLEGSADGTGKYTFGLGVNGQNADIDLTGNYLASGNGAELSLGLEINRLNMILIEKFSQESITDSEGYLTGDVDVSGTLSDPKYEGNLGFENINFFVTQLATSFAIKNETIRVDNSGLYLNSFLVSDSQKNDFSVTGKILTNEFSNPQFDLKLQADNFRILNSEQKEGDLFYGKIGLNADITVAGDLEVPVIRGDLKVSEDSDLTVIVPETELDIKAREGVVIFTNRKDPDDILTRTGRNEASRLTASLSGYDIQANLSVSPSSQFKIIIDERTNDNLEVSGTGNFLLGLEPNGRTTLSGEYNVNSGYYETNLYNLVNRKFDINPGSSITWSGDPFDAELDVNAIYNVRTSAAPLMVVRTSGESNDVINTYQQRLPFLVFINIEGQLLKPEIYFTLQMPEDEQGALGGDVYEQIQQLNNQDDELNKQVFSLLVLNRFFPRAGSDGSNGGPASIAIDNVNKVLSGQLNNFSNKIFGDSFELGFDLNSNGSGQGVDAYQQTQLGINARKKLFNDRLIVQVGSEVDVAGSENSSVGTPIIGNVSLEYLLTPDGRFKLQGFSRNEYEGVIDGQLAVSGIALIFTREFNKFKELWTKQVNEEAQKSSSENKVKGN